METEKAILGRRSVRQYENKPVPEVMIRKILKAGAMAPSATDRQPCRFIVITNREKITELSDKVKEKAGATLPERFRERMKLSKDIIFYEAPLLILIVAEKDDWAAVDCSLAAQNMMLAAYDLGLGSCFIGFARRLRDDRETLRSLGVKDSQELYCQLVFGYPKEWPEPKEREAKVQNEIN